ncbi:MAG: cyanophycin synthetase, partial [Gemmatimonadota bacterium]|nr:cyanophycin synthetase [Gemmatimonadota bacterium]
DTIRAGLLSFFPSPSMTPGRLNLLRIRNARVLVDYAHNEAALTGLMEMVQQLPASRRVGVLTAPGDRRDDDIRGLGRLAASLDRVILKEDEDRRGRRRGEIAELIMEGLRAGGMSEHQWETAPSEKEAVNRVLAELGDGDLVVILVDDVPGVLAQVQAQAPGANAAL